MVIEDIEGYTNSQTWEAWKDSINVLWDNTEVMFLLSVTVSLGAVLYTLMNYPRENQAEGNNSKGYKAVPGDSDKYAKNNRINKKSEVTEETSDSSSVLRSHTKEITQEIEKQMSEDDKKNEREAQSQQLAAIYKLMQDQQEKFGQTSIDDIKDQMKFYCR